MVCACAGNELETGCALLMLCCRCAASVRCVALPHFLCLPRPPCSLVISRIEEIEAQGGVEALARALWSGSTIWGDLQVRILLLQQ